jgi:hypothetical protein
MTRTLISYLGLRVIAQKPDLNRRGRHRFRYVRTPDDLGPFVNLSDSEPVIVGANPGLKGKEREELYDRWCQWTVQNESLPWHDPANRVKSFLILDQKQPDTEWLPIGVSILLPLTIDGVRNLHLNQDKVISKHGNAATLTSGDLARGSSTMLLLDTWIIRQRPSANAKETLRFRHYGWGIALLLRHLAEFWDPDSSAEFTFLCEPDNPKVGAVLTDLGFFEERRNATSGNLFILQYPLNKEIDQAITLDIAKHFMDNFRAIRGIPIE